MKLGRKLFAPWKVKKEVDCVVVHSSLVNLYHCVTNMVGTEKFSVGRLAIAGVWIDMVMNCQEQKPKEFLTVALMVSRFFP